MGRPEVIFIILPTLVRLTRFSVRRFFSVTTEGQGVSKEDSYAEDRRSEGTTGVTRGEEGVTGHRHFVVRPRLFLVSEIYGNSSVYSINFGTFWNVPNSFSKRY